MKVCIKDLIWNLWKWCEVWCSGIDIKKYTEVV